MLKLMSIVMTIVGVLFLFVAKRRTSRSGAEPGQQPGADRAPVDGSTVMAVLVGIALLVSGIVVFALSG